MVHYPGWNFGSDWDNPDLAFLLRREIWEFFNQRRREVPLVFHWYDGLRLNLYLGNDLSRQLFVAGCVEPNEFAFLNEILAPGMVFIDAGANDGVYTVFASQRVGPQGVVWAFEPSEREFSRLEQNVHLNDLANVHLFRVALADRNDEEELFIAGYEHEGHNTLGGFANPGVDLLRSERVAVRKLDDLAAEARLPKVDVIKMDVEGAEYRLIEGAREVLSRFRPVLLLEAAESALEKQGASRESLLRLLSSLQYEWLTFDDETGRPVRKDLGSMLEASDNVIAMPRESPVLAHFNFSRTRPRDPSASKAKKSEAALFNPARAYWNQRTIIARSRDRIRAMIEAANRSSDLSPYQWAQLMAVVLEYQPDLILELGRGKGNSTCAFTEASNMSGGRTHIVSLCLSNEWEQETLPPLRRLVPESWFAPLSVLRVNILDFDFETALSSAKRVLMFWDAHGFDIAECMLGRILPLVAAKEHLVIMHDLSDTRYCSEEQLEYGQHGLWRGNNWTGPRVKLGIIDSAVEQSVAALDFATRNHITLDSADHSLRTCLTNEQQEEMRSTLGECFDLQAHWFYFSLNEHPGPYKFPHYSPPAELGHGVVQERSSWRSRLGRTFLARAIKRAFS